jgi:hypothetical protein
MRNLFALITVSLLILNSCKKDKSVPPTPPGNPNNEITAMVSVGGTPDSAFKAVGNSTGFNKRIDSVRRDTIISVQGSVGTHGTYSRRAIQLTLINMTTPGTYVFRADAGPRQQAFCDYTIGDVFFSPIFLFYSTRGVNQPGTVTIESISPTNIRGSYTANCSNYVLIKNGKFQGEF